MEWAVYAITGWLRRLFWKPQSPSLSTPSIRDLPESDDDEPIVEAAAADPLAWADMLFKKSMIAPADLPPFDGSRIITFCKSYMADYQAADEDTKRSYEICMQGALGVLNQHFDGIDGFVQGEIPKMEAFTDAMARPIDGDTEISFRTRVFML
ncbi:hypothetical protein, partial [Rhizobium rhizogenes]